MSKQKAILKTNSAGAVKFELASNKSILKHEEEIAEILSILEHTEALVTDETVLSDFPIDDDKMDQIRRLSKKQFGSKALLVHVAEAVRKAARNKTKNKGKRIEE